MDELLRPGEAAAKLRVSAETLRRWVRAGHLRAIRLPGGAVRIPQAELDRILMTGERGGE